jgi:hypothetical protein
VSLNETVITNVAQDEYQYFTYEVNKSANLEVNVVDLVGNTFVYASRTNPHPYKYDNDIAFDLSSQKNKVIIISANIGSTVKRSTDNDDVSRQIYVSVTSDTDSASFKIKASECDPLYCTEGTNEMPNSSTRSIPLATNFVVFTFAMFMVFMELHDI